MMPIKLHLFENEEIVEINIPFTFYPNLNDSVPSIVNFIYRGTLKKYAVRENLSEVKNLWISALGENTLQACQHYAVENTRKMIGIVKYEDEEGELWEIQAEYPKDMNGWANKGPFYMIRTKAFLFFHDYYTDELKARSTNNANEYEDPMRRKWILKTNNLNIL